MSSTRSSFKPESNFALRTTRFARSARWDAISRRAASVRSDRRKKRIQLVVGLVIVSALAVLVFTLGSLHIPLYPSDSRETTVFVALAFLIAGTFGVFALILGRTLLRLAAERRSGQMGSRFKVKMVMGAMGVSMAPAVFLFFVSYALLNRTLNAWFPRPLEIANEQSQMLLTHFETTEFDRLNHLAEAAAVSGAPDEDFLNRNHAVDISWMTAANGKVISTFDF